MTYFCWFWLFCWRQHDNMIIYSFYVWFFNSSYWVLTVFQISCLYDFSIKSYRGWLNPPIHSPNDKTRKPILIAILDIQTLLLVGDSSESFSILSPWSSLYYNYVNNWVIIKCNILYEHLQHFFRVAIFRVAI